MIHFWSAEPRTQYTRIAKANHGGVLGTLVFCWQAQQFLTALLFAGLSAGARE
jgi:hypothetical protein